MVRGDAGKTAVKELGNGFSILHFATHGKFNTDAPLSSGLYLAKDSEADGVLTVSDLYALRWDAGSINAWFNDFAVEGNTTERPGRLEWLNATGTAVVATVDLGNLGIVRYAPLPVTAADAGIARVQVKMYCETVNFSFS